MTEEKLIDKIEAYLRDELPGDERAAFKLEIANSPELRRQLVLHQKLEQTFSDQEARRLEETLTQITGEYLNKSRVRTLTTQRWWFAAAAAVAILVTFIALYPSHSLAPEEVYGEYYELYSSQPFAPNNRGGEKDSVRSLIRVAYDAGRFDEALGLMDEIEVSQDLSIMKEFYSGICYLELGDSEKALEVFDRIITTDTSLYKDNAIWYAAMAAFKTGDYETGRKYLERIKDHPGEQGEHASEILRRLK